MGMMTVPMSLQEPDFMSHGVLKAEMFGQELWITTTTVGSWIITATLLLIAWIASRKLKKVNATDTPGTFQCVDVYKRQLLIRLLAVYSTSDVCHGREQLPSKGIYEIKPSSACLLYTSRCV